MREYKDKTIIGDIVVNVHEDEEELKEDFSIDEIVKYKPDKNKGKDNSDEHMIMGSIAYPVGKNKETKKPKKPAKNRYGTNLTLAGNVILENPGSTYVEEEQELEVDLEPNDDKGGFLMGSVNVKLPNNKKEEGTIARGGLAGHVIYPTPRQVVKPKPVRHISDEITGHVILRPSFGKAIKTVSSFLEKYKNIIRSKFKPEDKLTHFVHDTQEEFFWNQEYLADKTIDPQEKMTCAKDIAIDNLQSIRYAAKSLQQEFDKTDTKGNQY